jgi:transcriptional regulator with XRE-family HTH domain
MFMPDWHSEGKHEPAHAAPKYAYPAVAGAMSCGHTACIMKNMRAIRQRRGLNQTQLAEMVGANQATISKIERGVGNPTLDVIERIAEALKVEPADLFAKSELKQRVYTLVAGIKDPQQQKAALVVLSSMSEQGSAE